VVLIAFSLGLERFQTCLRGHACLWRYKLRGDTILARIHIGSVRRVDMTSHPSRERFDIPSFRRASRLVLAFSFAFFGLLGVVSRIHAEAIATFQGLGDLAGGSFLSLAFGVSADGSVVVGQGNSASGTQAFRWTSGTGMVGLGDLPGGSFGSLAFGVSADGSVVVGQGTSASGGEAFLWTSDSGMQSLASALSAYGVTPTGFTRLTEAWDVKVAANNATVVGHGNSTLGVQAFRAQIPIISASLADELLSLTPGLNSDTLSLDVSATKLLYGQVGKYEFDFTTDGIYDLVLDVGTPLFDSYWDPFSESFLFPELDVRSYYPAINAGGFGSLAFTTTIRMTHENGTAINTSEAIITVVPEAGSWLLGSIALLGIAVTRLAGRRVA
jgi:probable HAF family extracellular repeat protein